MLFIKNNPLFMGLILLVVSGVLFLTLNITGDFAFAFELRLKKLLALIVVGVAIGVSTLLFQTVTNNPILTPALLGYDALYVLIKSLMIFFLGVASVGSFSPVAKFGLEVALMLGASLLLFKFLFNKNRQDLTRLILVGVVFGILFRSLSGLVARLISPDDFVVVQAASFAQFNTINLNLLLVSSLICAGCFVLAWRVRYACDILMLGRNMAINLGIDYHKLTLYLLFIIAVLVSVSTALVGPVTFFGLLVCALTNQLSQFMHHKNRLVLVSVLSALCLVFGQMAFEHWFKMAGVLSVAIELIGGVVFLVLIFKQKKGAL